MPFFENAHDIHISTSKFQDFAGNVIIHNNASRDTNAAGTGVRNSTPVNREPVLSSPHTRTSGGYFTAGHRPLHNDNKNFDDRQHHYFTAVGAQYDFIRERTSSIRPGLNESYYNPRDITANDGLPTTSSEVERQYLSPSSFPTPATGSRVRATTPFTSNDAFPQAISTRSRSFGSQMEQRVVNSGNIVNHANIILSHSNIRDPTPLISRLENIFTDVREYKQLLACQGPAAQKLLDIFQYILDVLKSPTPTFKRELIVAMQRLAAKSGSYPMCYELDAVTTVTGHPQYSGGFADVYKADLGCQKVCLKVVRAGGAMREDFMKMFAKEAVLWGQLSHPNLLPFYGIYRFQDRFSLVSPWMEHGDMNQYLRKHVYADRLLLVFDILNGLRFLHGMGIVHGDLKGPNILVDGSGSARLADFGISSISDPNILAWTSHSSVGSKGGSARWQAPELFNPHDDEVVHNTVATDVYAWSCVVYEAFTGKIPYAHLSLEATVLLRVMAGERPARPPPSDPCWQFWGLTEYIWSLMEDCWKTHPASRPTVDEVFERLLPVLKPDTRSNEDGGVLSPALFRVPAHQKLEEGGISVRNLDSLLGYENAYMSGLRAADR